MSRGLRSAASRPPRIWLGLGRQIAEWRSRQERQKELYRAGTATLAETEAIVRDLQARVSALEADLAALTPAREFERVARAASSGPVSRGSRSAGV